MKIEIGERLWDVDELSLIIEEYFKTDEEPTTEEPTTEEPTIEAKKEVMKTVDGEDYPASAFLVVVDPEKVDTWHLPVMDAKGKPDRNRMTAAWNALHKGLMGQKYGGPNKKEALAALEALYKSDGVELPMEEMWQSTDTYSSSVRSAFMQSMNKDGMHDMPNCYCRDVLVSHPMLGDAVIVEDKGKTFAVQFVDMGGMYTFYPREQWIEVMQTYIPASFNPQVRMAQSAETAEQPEPSAESAESGSAEISECESGIVDDGISESEELSESGSSVMRIKTRLIRPGFGNARDNHFYSEEMLRRDSKIFEGAKMYETDHRDSEKSNRTWVSTVDKIVGWDNGPIAEVVVHDPNFAERARNLKKAGLLDRLECSILANGSVGPVTEVGGRKGKVVLGITEAKAVDWVTKAGAGGQAVGLSESDAEPVEETAVEVTEVTEPVEVPVGESQPLSEAAVGEFLSKTSLPEFAKDRIKQTSFLTESDLNQAVLSEIEYLKKATGSGKPVSSGNNKPAPETTRESLKESESRKNAVNAYFLGGRK